MNLSSQTPAAEGTEQPQLERTDAMEQGEVNEVMESLPAVRSRGPFYALTFRNFRLFFYGQLISVAGTWMQTVAQNWVIWDITRDARWLGVVNGASAIPYVLFSIWGGQVADRYSKRAVLVWTQTIAMVLAFALALLATGWIVKLQAWHIVTLSALMGLTNAFNMPAQQAFVTEMVDNRDALGNAIALSSLRFNLARFVGPIMAGIVLVKLGGAWCFFLNGFSYIAVIVSLLMMRLKPAVKQDHAVNVWEGFTYIAGNRRVFRVVLLVGIGSLFAWSVSTLYPLISDLFNRRDTGYSQMMAVNGVGAALGAALLAGYGDRISRRLQVYGGALLFCVSLLLLSVAPTFWAVLAQLVLGGFAMIIFGMSANTLVQEEVPDVLRGRVMAVYSLVFQGLLPIGGLEIGFLAKHITANAAIRWNAAICLLITLVILGWSLVDRRRISEASEAALSSNKQ